MKYMVATSNFSIRPQEAKMQFHLQDDGTGIVAAEGDLTVYNAPDLGKALSEALESSDRVELDFENVKTIDLSCLQLVCSAFLTFEDMKKTIAFGGGLPAAVEKAVKDAGYPGIAATGGRGRGKSSSPQRKVSGGRKKSAGRRRVSGGRRKAKTVK
jgi:anti-anti-sigma regulatory factor